MRYYNSILECVGHTPLIKLNNIVTKDSPLILVKAEFLNPGGSVKDRIGGAMIEDAEKKGLLKKNGVIVEPTSGNTGVGLALAANLQGYKLIFTMPDKMSKEKELLLEAYGGKVVRTRTDVAPKDPESYYSMADMIVNETQNSFCPNQYYNKRNPDAHYETTGPEIWEDCPEITHFICGMGTGGTITGAGRFLKEQNPNIKVVGVDPEGSIYYDEFYGIEGKGARVYKTEGIGEDFIPPTIDFDVIDEVIKVSDKDAYKTAQILIKEESMLVGSSSGAAMYAALDLGKRLSKKCIVVVLLPDTGRNYLSTLFNDDWMNKHIFL
ncbi:MAG: PLP-dependent cysteine synthase family protein [Candidatus Hodarchaeales archaeon]|jgi:cystathionine beta-synthase